jgi:hypothetical protein
MGHPMMRMRGIEQRDQDVRVEQRDHRLQFVS